MVTSRMAHPLVPVCLVLLAVVVGAVFVGHAQGVKKTLVAHRGASSYAPEHTAAAYRLAIEQGADFVEQDLQVTKDGQLVCLHDLTLDRTTNVKEVFPGRSRAFGDDSRALPAWPVSDFTLAEIKQLDAGAWFDPKFKGEKILTFEEAIDLVRGKAGIYPETKAPEVYGSLGFDMEGLVMEVLKKKGLDAPGADPKTPVIIQSFSADSLKKMVKMGVKLPLVLLVTDRDRDVWLTKEKLADVRTFAWGIGPAKGIIAGMPQIVTWAHEAGLTVTPYTFRSAGMPAGKTVREEMDLFLYTYGVDALFTDNPDQFPRK